MSVLRGRLLFAIFFTFFALITARLFFWQVVLGDRLKSEAEKQYFEILPIPAARGEILTSDGFPLVSNETAYLVFAEVKKITDPQFPQKIAKILEVPPASVSAKILPDLYWVALAHKVPQEKIDKISRLDLSGIGWSREDHRFYPEASSGAHLLGFVGGSSTGEDKGYFGLEGFYDRELRGRAGSLKQEKDVRGAPILLGGRSEEMAKDGRSLILHLDRSIQFIVEKKLAEGIKKYGAKQGSVVIMDPNTGGILAMASFPSYDPAKFSEVSFELFKNPVVADSYEPGSTFKVAILAAALDAGVVKPSDIYQDEGPVKIGEYLIKTWNEKYHGQESVKEILERSCNVGMVWVSKKLGSQKLVEYLQKFGLGERTGIDLEEEETPNLRPRDEWKEIDLATASFGQGIAVTSIQMLRVVAAIANGGKLLKPHVVAQVKDSEGKTIEIKPEVLRQVIRPETAVVLTELMVSAVENGEARWARPAGFRIAGKTGTAQIPVAGHYEEDRTIASFVGFAPADKPKFVMLVRLTEPTSSPWGSETAAPLFFDIAKELFTYYGISPSE
ncbi:MAG: cell division protein FtsI (penicillin-binding protein 3) [Microgenomates group bacterium LiPW_16]|nr:MAG: cell division protein FtsI (penicillin-binding protein 3) [Microgenomates group bacterium LiPW_16]